MKLRNKKTGEIGYFCFANWNDPTLIIADDHGVQLAKYNSLAKLNEKWEDAPDEYWCISCCGDVDNEVDEGTEVDKTCKEIGNYFETKEEAEKAVEKLKAVKRLKDKGFKLKSWYMPKNILNIEIDGGFPEDVSLCDVMDDLDIIFGGEE